MALAPRLRQDAPCPPRPDEPARGGREKTGGQACVVQRLPAIPARMLVRVIAAVKGIAPVAAPVMPVVPVVPMRPVMPVMMVRTMVMTMAMMMGRVTMTGVDRMSRSRRAHGPGAHEHQRHYAQNCAYPRFSNHFLLPDSFPVAEHDQCGLFGLPFPLWPPKPDDALRAYTKTPLALWERGF